MTGSSGPETSLDPAVLAIEAHMKWRVRAAVIFMMLMAFLLALAILANFAPPRTARGLPDDPDVRAAQALLEGGVPVIAGGLRFRSTIMGDLPHGARSEPADHAALVDAHAHLEQALKAAPFDPRTLTAMGHVELALRRDERAESRYRLALDLLPHYGEARLGLGVALAQRARRTANAHERRRLLMQSAGQFASVREDEPVHDCALYNQAVLLMLIGRREEALRVGGSYLKVDADSPWARDLRLMLEPRA